MDKVIEDTKIKFEINLIESSSKSPREVWNYINKKLDKKEIQIDINSIHVCHIKIAEHRKIANFMNTTHLCETGTL